MLLKEIITSDAFRLRQQVRKMDLSKFNEKRIFLNKKLADSDPFFDEFSLLDRDAYSQGSIPKKYKELTGLSISIISQCEECILFHMQNCKENDCSKDEIVEVIKIAVIGGGSLTYPWARKAIALLDILEIA